MFPSLALPPLILFHGIVGLEVESPSCCVGGLFFITMWVPHLEFLLPLRLGAVPLWFPSRDVA